MGKRRRVYLPALAIAIIAITAALLFRPSLPLQPYYQGRSLDSWLDEWATNQWGSDASKYTRVVAAIGTNAIPFVLRRLEQDDSFLKNKYREIWPKLPASSENSFRGAIGIHFMACSQPQWLPMRFNLAGAMLFLCCSPG